MNEQMVSVHDFVERKVMDAAFDVLAHDVDFGEVSFNYLQKGRENFGIQRRVSSVDGSTQPIVVVSKWRHIY